jgi:hypothetical protein
MLMAILKTMPSMKCGLLECGSPSGTDNFNALQQDALEVLGEEQDDEKRLGWHAKCVFFLLF